MREQFVYGPLTFDNFLELKSIELQADIHDLTNPFNELDLNDKLEMVSHLGQAAHKFMMASQAIRLQRSQSDESILPEVVVVDEVKSPLVVIPEVVVAQDEVSEATESEAVDLQVDVAAATDDVKTELNGEELKFSIPATLDLSPKQVRMFALLLQNTTPGEWFKASQLGVENDDQLSFNSLASTRSAVSTFINKLYDANLLQSKGARGGRRLRLLAEDYDAIISDKLVATESIQTDTVENSQAFVYTPPLLNDEVVLPEPSPQLRAAFEKNKQINTAADFAAELVMSMATIIDDSAGMVTRAEMVHTLAENLQIDSQDAEQVMKNMISGSLFHVLRSEGKSRLREGPKPTIVRSSEDASSTECNSANTWMDVDIHNAVGIFELLLDKDHWQQGIQPKHLITALNIDDQDKEEFRRTIRKLSNAKYLYFNPRANPNTRSDHSKKLLLPMITFANQDMKKRARDDREGLLKELQGLVGQPCSSK